MFQRFEAVRQPAASSRRTTQADDEATGSKSMTKRTHTQRRALTTHRASTIGRGAATAPAKSRRRSRGGTDVGANGRVQSGRCPFGCCCFIKCAPFVLVLVLVRLAWPGRPEGAPWGGSQWTQAYLHQAATTSSQPHPGPPAVASCCCSLLDSSSQSFHASCPAYCTYPSSPSTPQPPTQAPTHPPTRLQHARRHQGGD